MAEKAINTELVQLKPSEVAATLQTLIADNEPCLLIGPPGCGKSDLTAQAAEAAGADLIVTHPVTSDPTDAKGLPWLEVGKDHAEFKPFGDFYKALNATKKTVLFIDDLGQAPDAVQASYMQPVLNRQVDGKRFPDHVTFIAATNRRTDKAGVRGILEPVKGRFTLIHMISDVDDFCTNLFLRGKSYGLDDDTIVYGAAYFRFVPDALNKFDATVDMTNSPTERNWVKAMKFASMKLPSHIEHALIAGRVGAGYAAQFEGFIRNARLMPSLDVILSDPTNAVIPDENQTLWAVAVGLASRATENNFQRISTYAKRLNKEGRGEFASVLVRDSIRRQPRIQSTKPYIELVSGDMGRLMTGRI